MSGAGFWFTTPSPVPPPRRRLPIPRRFSPSPQSLRGPPERPGMERNALLVTQHFENVPGRNAAEGIKAVLGQMNPMARRDHLPRAPMQGHGVRQGAVAIEDETFYHVWGVG